MEELALTPAQMTITLQTHLRADHMEDKRHMMHSSQVRGAASRSMDGTAMDVLMEDVGWNSGTGSRRYVGMTASVAAAGVKHSRGTAFIEAPARPLPKQFSRSYAAFPRNGRTRAH